MPLNLDAVLGAWKLNDGNVQVLWHLVAVSVPLHMFLYTCVKHNSQWESRDPDVYCVVMAA